MDVSLKSKTLNNWRAIFTLKLLNVQKENILQLNQLKKIDQAHLHKSI